MLRVSTPGVVLASVVEEVSRYGGDCEGVLWGTQVVESSVSHSDSHDVAVSAATAVTTIHSVAVTGPPFSFYDSSAAVLPDRLAAVPSRPGLRPVGWFSFRRDSPLLPSVRDAAVHASLCGTVRAGAAAPAAGGVAKAGAGTGTSVDGVFSDGLATPVGAGAAATPGDGRQPVLWGEPLVLLVLTTQRESAATVGFDYRMFVGVGGGTRLAPVSLNVLNLAANAEAEYKSFAASSPLGLAGTSAPHFRDILAELGGEQGGAVACGAQPPEVLELERLFKCASAQVSAMLADVEKREAEAEALALETHKLRAAAAAPSGAPPRAATPPLAS